MMTSRYDKRKSGFLNVLFALAVLLTSGCPGKAAGFQPTFLSYQARLRDGGGVLLSGSHTLYFSVYAGGSASPGSGTLIYKESSVLSVMDGVANHLVGSGTPLNSAPLTPAAFLLDEPYYLEVAVDAESNVIAPRTLLSPVPFAARSARADALNLAQVIYVGQTGGEFTSLQEAVQSVPGTVQSPVVIRVGPGFYDGPLALKPYTIIEGAGPGITNLSLSEAGSTPTVTMAEGCELRGLTVRRTGDAQTEDATAIAGESASFRLNDLSISVRALKTATGLEFTSCTVAMKSSSVSIESRHAGATGMETRGSKISLSDVEVEAHGGVSSTGFRNDDGSLYAVLTRVTSGRGYGSTGFRNSNCTAVLISCSALAGNSAYASYALSNHNTTCTLLNCHLESPSTQVGVGLSSSASSGGESEVIVANCRIGGGQHSLRNGPGSTVRVSGTELFGGPMMRDGPVICTGCLQSGTGTVTVSDPAGGAEVDLTATGIARTSAATETFNIQNPGSGAMVLQVDGSPVFTAQNDGAGSGLDADSLDGFDGDAYARLNSPGVWTALQTYSAVPTGSGVSAGSLSVNPPSAAAGTTLAGFAVGGAQKMRLDAEGDLFLTGKASIGGGTAISQVLSQMATVYISLTSPHSSSDYSVSFAGASPGDTVLLGIPDGAMIPNTSWSAWVTATNTVKIRFNNYDNASNDPPSLQFRVTVIKF